jgi:N-acetylmuramoyl-L-alanine amidase
MTHYNWLIGVLLNDARLDTRTVGKVFLTRNSEDSTSPPQTNPLPIAESELGKLALVKGRLRDNVLYSAEIVETKSYLIRALVEELATKAVIDMENMQNLIAQLNEGEQAQKLCALVIGHKKSSPGAVNPTTGLTEFDFNDDLARRIETKVKFANIQRVYRRTYNELPGDINGLNPDFTLSLHCNAYNRSVSGTEVLYYYKSRLGREIAGVILEHLVMHLDLPNRGIKGRTVEDRGGYLLRYTNAPCVIAEPFFIDNDSDLARAQQDLDGLAAAYAGAIDSVCESVLATV